MKLYIVGFKLLTTIGFLNVHPKAKIKIKNITTYFCMSTCKFKDIYIYKQQMKLRANLRICINKHELQYPKNWMKRTSPTTPKKTKKKSK